MICVIGQIMDVMSSPFTLLASLATSRFVVAIQTGESIISNLSISKLFVVL